MKRAATVLALAGLALVVLTGCSRHHEIPEPEGQTVKVDNLSYTVFITRELNLHDVEDRAYYQGPDAPPGFAYFGVFIQVCNDYNKAPLRTPARNFRIVDTTGQDYEPLTLSQDNVFAYRPQQLGAKECMPQAGSIAATGPIGGSLLLFKLPVASIENRPLELEINPPAGEEAPESQRIELDI